MSQTPNKQNPSSRPATFAHQLPPTRTQTSRAGPSSSPYNEETYPPPQIRTNATHLPQARPSTRPSSRPSTTVSRTQVSSTLRTLDPPITRLPSRAPSPPNLKSILLTPLDKQMASRQTRLTTLSPLDRQRQEKWAQSQIARSGVCPEGYDWEQSDEFGGGYICGGKKHFISNGLIAEGLGGVYLWSGWPEEDEIYGPYYRDPKNSGRVVYGGVEPRDRYAPDGFGTM